MKKKQWIKKYTKLNVIFNSKKINPKRKKTVTNYGF